ncbi:beta-porphyranase A-like [Haliotis asinina]|uniref:beta-porphyranase A-like n=1 Tax=Haliotis asinina TaxID=109174 RepID=UPI00353256A5
MICTLAIFLLALSIDEASSNTTVTIYPQWLAKGGHIHYDRDRWSKHNGLEQDFLIQSCRSIRTDSGRWMNRDLNDRLFQDWPEDPNRGGYPDPNYLKNVTKQQELFSNYLANINSGYKNEMIMVMKGIFWPTWMDQSQHHGQFPNNIDAASEFILLMMEGVYDYTRGQIPPYFEVINEPDSQWQILNFTTVSLFHKSVAEKLHAKFNIKVSGPTLDGYTQKSDVHHFSYWNQVASFMDVTLAYLDTFSFHSYNTLVVSGKSHRFSGMNEARLVAFVDLVENYACQKQGKIVPLVISEYGRGPVEGIDKYAPSGIVDFSTIYQANAHRFTQLSLREYVDRGVVFLLSNEQSPEHDSLNWSLFNRQGKPTRIVDVFEFWYNFTAEYSFIRTVSQCDGQERTVSPLAMSSPSNNETVILLHSYSQMSQTIKLHFQDDWIKPTTGEATCITIKDNWNPVMTFNEPFDIGKTQGMVELPPEATCRFTFKTPSDQQPKVTVNETTYYGADMVIPIQNSVPTTTISLPKGVFYSAKLRVSTSLPVNETNNLAAVTFNGHSLGSFYKLYDSDKFDNDTWWEVWEFDVPNSLLTTANIIRVFFSNHELPGYVSSVVLVTAKLVPSNVKL